MGLAITIACAALMALLALVGRRWVVYVLLFLFVFFDELGIGFTSFAGSFVFNQDFVDFGYFRFIEFVIAAAYAATLISYRGRRPPFMASEGKLGYLFVFLIVILLFVEYFLHGSTTISDWRLIVSGIMVLHLFVMLVNSEEKLISFVKILLIMLTLRALIGLVAYALGHGVMSPRGVVPFFWDSRQVDAFAYGVILLTAYLANSRGLQSRHRIFPQALAIIMLAVLSITILLSIRRTVWMMALLGIVATLLLSKRVKLPHYVGLGFIAMAGFALILALPISEGFRSRMGTYFGSMNLLDQKVAGSYENEVHTDNVRQYSRMIMENPSVLTLGFRGYPGANYSNLPKLYSKDFPLGVAHNGILRTIYFYGLGGLVIYLFFYVRIFFLYGDLKRLPEHKLMKHIGIASLILLFMEFSSSLTLVPPFYTTSKGLFYTFLAVFVARASLHFGATPATDEVTALDSGRRGPQPGKFLHIHQPGQR